MRLCIWQSADEKGTKLHFTTDIQRKEQNLNDNFGISKLVVQGAIRQIKAEHTPTSATTKERQRNETVNYLISLKCPIQSPILLRCSIKL